MVARRRQRRAISYILSVILMTVVTTSLASVTLLWALGQVSISQSDFSGAINARAARIQERIVIEDVRFINSTAIRIYIRNVGGIGVVMDTAYIDHRQISSQSPTKLSLGINQQNYVDVITAQTLSSGTTYRVTVATTRGSTATGSHTY
jgi:FlaG/FlaF family flagellin (archaellin)